MVDQSLIFLVLSVSHLLQQSVSNADSIAERCPIDARVNLTGETADSSGLTVSSGFVFPLESRWVQNGEIFGCVCYNRPKCLTMYCPNETFMYLKMDKDCDFVENHLDSMTPLLYSVDSPIQSIAMDDHYVTRLCDPQSRYQWPLNKKIIEEPQKNRFRIKSDGSVYIPGRNVSTMYNFDSYCLCSGVDFYIFGPMINFAQDCSATALLSTAFVRYNHNQAHENSTQPNTVISHVGMIISIPFLIITFIVYTVLPELRNIHGLTLRGYVGCLIVAYTTLAVIQTTGPISDVACLVFAFTIYFSFLATFFWLNVVCFDIWWTFGGFRSFQRSVRKFDRKKFFTYSLYAWGFPILLTGVCMIVTFVPGVSDNLITPEFEVESICWFKTKTARAIYLYGPMAATIITNIFFFISTAVKIINQKKDTARHLEGVSSERHDVNRQRFNLYLKLFIVMGINWSMEIVSWFFEDLRYMWCITDLGNALQGLFIFIIFICKKNIKLLLVKHFGVQISNVLSWCSTRNVPQSSTPQSDATPVSKPVK